MTAADSSLPLRDGPNGPQMETRPVYVEEWLDSLPYIDFAKTSQLLYQGSKATNEQQLKPAVRLELAALYHRPYQYYIETQICNINRPGLPAPATAHSQLNMLKLIAANLAFSCRLAFEEALQKKTLWKTSKPPLPAMVSALHYLSHALLFSYLEYSPAPKNVWKQLHFIFDFASGIDKANTTIIPVAGKAKTHATTITAAYLQIVMASLADPYHLPFGAVWEIYRQLAGCSGLIDILEYTPAKDPASRFLIDLASDQRPLPMSGYEGDLTAASLRVIDASNLTAAIDQQLLSIAEKSTSPRTIRLAAHYERPVLTHISTAWGVPQRRQSKRRPRHGKLQMVCGINAIYYHVNGQRDLTVVPGTSVDADLAVLAEEPDVADNRELAGRYRADSWRVVDTGPGGVALMKEGKPIQEIRVGDIVGLAAVAAENSRVGERWSVGAIRWLMIRQGGVFRLGIQLLSSMVVPATIRALSGSLDDTSPNRALLVPERNKDSGHAVISGRGFYSDGRELEINTTTATFVAKCHHLREAAVGFDYFQVR